MIDYREVFRKMPMAMIYVKYSFLGNEDFNMEIKYISDKMLLLLNMDHEDAIFKDFLIFYQSIKKMKIFSI